MTDLHEHLTADPDGFDHERWVCDDPEKASWALRKLHRIRSEKARIRQQADAEIARVEVWRADALGPLEHSEAFFVGQLRGFYEQVAGDDGPKTYKLPTGALKMRAGRPKTTVVDEQEFVNWALVNAPDALAEPKPLVSAMKDWPRDEIDGVTVIVTPEGERVPGVEVVRSPDSFTADTSDITEEPF